MNAYLKPFETFKQSLVMATLMPVSDAFCFFNSDKVPYKADGTAGVKVASIGSDDLMELHQLEIYSGRLNYCGIAFHNAIAFTPNGHRFVCIDVDYKRCAETPLSAIKLETWAKNNNHLYERSISNLGCHIYIAVDVTSDLPSKLFLETDRAEVELFHSHNIKCLLLTGNNTSGIFVDEPVDLKSVFRELEIPWKTNNPFSPKSVFDKTTGEIFDHNPMGQKDLRYLNTVALKHLDDWVPSLFPKASKTTNGGFRMPSTHLGRNLEEDISFHPTGIKDFGVADQGDTNGGKRTAVNVIAEHMFSDDQIQAADWLRKIIGYEKFNHSQDLGPSPEWYYPQTLPEGIVANDFSYELLPDSLKEWIHDISKRMQCPEDFAAVTAVVAISSLIGAKAVIRPKQKDTWEVTPNLWGCVVGRPGVMKTPTVRAILKPLFELDILERKNYDFAMEIWEDEEVLKDAARKGNTNKINKFAASGENEEAKLLMAKGSPKPILKRLIVNDTTVESLQEIMQQNPWGFLCYRDELYGLFKSMEKQGQESSRSFYLSSYDGDQPHTVDRVTRGSIHIPRACLSLFGTIQPARLLEYIRGATHGGMADDGLLQRFGLMVYPDIGKNWSLVDEFPNEFAVNRAYEVFTRLAGLETRNDKPSVWQFTPQAQGIFYEWFTSLNKELQTGELSPTMESHLSKYRKLIPSLALIFAHVDTPHSNCVVETRELIRALKWYPYLRSHAEKIFQPATTPEISGAKKILKQIKLKVLNNGFTERDIDRKKWSGLDNGDAVKNSLAILVEYDYLKFEQNPVSTKGGRPSGKYFINPHIHNE